MAAIVVLTHPMLTKLIESVGYGLPEYISMRTVNVTITNIENIALTIDRNKEADVFLSAGGNAIACSGLNLQTRFVNISVTGFDLMSALFRARKFSDRVALVTYKNATEGLKYVKSIFSMEIVQLVYSTMDELDEVFEIIRTMGITVVIGSSLIMERAELRNLTGIFIYSPDGVIRAFDLAVSIIESTLEEQKKAEEFKTILDCAHSGIIAVDNAGVIKAFNPVAVKISGVPKEKAIGSVISDIITGTSLTRVLKSKKGEYNQIQSINGTPILTNRVPVIVGGVAVGAVATFQDFNSIRIAEDKIKSKHSEKGFVAKTTFQEILGSSKSMQAVREKAEAFAANAFTVLITGETGTGKELFAAAIHNSGARKDGPFVAVNCSAFHESLLESELFGYVEGAFTGALKSGRAGLFEMAHGGTLFLDEIADFPLHLQVRLLRTLEERTTMRISSDRVTPVDIRVIAATNRNLFEMMEAGLFRRDLYYRLNVLSLHLPPLRERPGDMPLLAEHFIRQLDLPLDKKVIASMGVILQRRGYTWPGNVRELRNIMERFLSLYKKGDDACAVMAEVLADYPQISSVKPPEGTAQQGVAKTGGSKSQLAKELGISRTTLWRRTRRAEQNRRSST